MIGVTWKIKTVFIKFSVQCFPQRCQACRESFGGLGSIASYDCAGECGLCDLCLGTPNIVPDCDRW